jgi:hypothetical protein
VWVGVATAPGVGDREDVGGDEGTDEDVGAEPHPGPAIISTAVSAMTVPLIAIGPVRCMSARTTRGMGSRAWDRSR